MLQINIFIMQHFEMTDWQLLNLSVFFSACHDSLLYFPVEFVNLYVGQLINHMIKTMLCLDI